MNPNETYTLQGPDLEIPTAVRLPSPAEPSGGPLAERLSPRLSSEKPNCQAAPEGHPVAPPPADGPAPQRELTLIERLEQQQEEVLSQLDALDNRIHQLMAEVLQLRQAG